MALEHARFATPEYPCAYLAGRSAALDVRLLTDISPAETEHLVERGWRRFGAEYFRPVCTACGECVSLRVPVAEFNASKSQRRVLRKCAGVVEVRIATPTCDLARLDLYAKWHAAREAASGWEGNQLEEDNYRRQFCFPQPCAREMTYWIAGRLVGVSLVDAMPRSLSSIYFFFDPDFSDLSLGIFSALCEIAWARQLGKEQLYFGYKVDGCKSLEYKLQFRPYELLIDRPGEDEPATWLRGSEFQSK